MARIAIGIGEIGRVWSGEQTLFVRSPGGSFDKVQPGTKLWLAEPFYLERAFDSFAPASARDRGAKPTFAVDVLRAPQTVARTHGKRHAARSLCREWHRAHLLVRSRTELRLQDLTAAQLANLGFRSDSAFAAHWNVEAALGGVRNFHWEHNPRALLFEFELVAEPIAFPVKPPPVKRGPRRPRPDRSAAVPPAGKPASLVDAAQNFARAYEQPRHLSATAKNPIDLPACPVRRVVAEPEPTPTTEKPVPAPESNLLPEARAPLPSEPHRPYQRVHDQPAIAGEVFTTGKGDKAFLAALNRERPAASPGSSSGLASGPAQLRRRQTMAPLPSATGTCPRCGTRIAYGCEHYPAHAADQDAAA